MTLPVLGLFFIIPPHGSRKGEPDDFQPFLDIIADQLRSAYWDGIGEVADGSWRLVYVLAHAHHASFIQQTASCSCDAQVSYTSPNKVDAHHMLSIYR